MVQKEEKCSLILYPSFILKQIESEFITTLAYNSPKRGYLWSKNY